LGGKEQVRKEVKHFPTRREKKKLALCRERREYPEKKKGQGLSSPERKKPRHDVLEGTRHRHGAGGGGSEKRGVDAMYRYGKGKGGGDNDAVSGREGQKNKMERDGAFLIPREGEKKGRPPSLRMATVWRKKGTKGIRGETVFSQKGGKRAPNRMKGESRGEEKKIPIFFGEKKERKKKRKSLSTKGERRRQKRGVYQKGEEEKKAQDIRRKANQGGKG